MTGSRRHCAQGYYKGLGGVLSLGGKEDHRDDGNTWGRKGLGITPGGDVNGSHGTSPHKRVHQAMAGDHSGKCGLPLHL